MRNKEYQGWEEGWAVVEVGNDTIAGWVACEEKFLQIDVPAVEGQDEFTRFIAVDAVRTVTPCSKDFAIRYVAGNQTENDGLCRAAYLGAASQAIPDPDDDDYMPF